MATTREDAKAMLEAAKKNKKFLMIGLNQRLMPPHVKAKKILQGGSLGKVLSFRTAFSTRAPRGGRSTRARVGSSKKARRSWA